MKLEELKDLESYQPPKIEVGDEVKVGRFKNRKAIVKSITKDKNNQPVLKTNKGEHKLFKPRISKLEDEKEEELDEADQAEPRSYDSIMKSVVKANPKASTKELSKIANELHRSEIKRFEQRKQN